MRYVQHQNVATRSVAEAHLLIPLNGISQSVYTLNETGCRLWELIAQPLTEDQLAKALLANYELSHEAAQRDVLTFLDDMIRMGLVDRVI